MTVAREFQLLAGVMLELGPSGRRAAHESMARTLPAPPDTVCYALLDEWHAHAKARYSASPRRIPSSLAERARHFIDDHMDDRITMDDVASTCQCSTRTVVRAFMAAYRISPSQYMDWRRFHALSYLLAHGVKVEAAAFLAGLRSRKAAYRLIRSMVRIATRETVRDSPCGGLRKRCAVVFCTTGIARLCREAAARRE